jgi:phthiocerol/phenolphthiocerol synthesis type-I polyketide synthase D
LARRIEVDVASHHRTIDPILPELRSALSDLVPTAPTIPLISTTGHADGTTRDFDADYWVANLRDPVRFAQAVTVALEDHDTFLEVSPHPLLTYAIADTLESTSSTDDCVVTSAMKRGEDETLFFHTQLATLGAAEPDSGRFVHIPPAPWLHSTYWVANRLRSRTDAHPLLGVHVEMPGGRDHAWQADAGTGLGWLADHQVDGQAVMPAAGFAEMALAAGSQALGVPPAAVAADRLEVERMLPLDRATQVTTQLSRDTETGGRVEIHSRSARGTWCRHAVAHVGMAQRDVSARRPDPAAEAGTAVSPAEFYATLRHAGLCQGPAFTALTRIVRRPGGVVETEIVLPDEVADHPSYCIHPVMLDAALQSLAAAVPAQSPQDPTAKPYLPASLARIRVFGRVGRRARCHAELVDHGEGGGRSGRITLVDDTGTPTAEIAGVELRRIDSGTVLPLERKVFDTVWVESPETGRASSAELAGKPAGSWLVLADPDAESAAETTALVAAFTARLRSPTRHVISAELSDEAALSAAFAETAADPQRPPVGVIVFVGKRSFEGTDDDGPVARARGLIWAVLQAAQVAARATTDGPHPTSPRLWVITRNGLPVGDDDPGDPAVGALQGLIRTWRFPGEAARVLADEPDLAATLVDLDSADDPDNLVATLIGELESTPGDDLVAWRQQRRYVQRLSRAALDAGERAAAIRADGSYIVTGGLGGLGMVAARWLARRGAGRLILNGRTDPQRSDLGDLANAADVVFVRGDIAAPGVAEQLVAAAEETGRPLRGVIHAAGVSGDGLVAAVTRDGLERVWAAKAAGALRLHAVTTTRQLDWWVGFSSMASLLGLPGQAAYATANAWLDGLAAWRRASGLPATVINWGQWSDVGMSRSLTFSVLDPTTPDEGIEALEALVGANLTRVGVARLRLDRATAAIPGFRELGYFQRVVPELDAALDSAVVQQMDPEPAATGGDRSAAGEPDRPGAASPPAWSQMSAEDARVALQTELQSILASELRMPASAVDPDVPFPALGMDSMMAMMVMRQTQRLVGIELSLTMLQNHPTISSLAAHLAETLAPQHASVQGVSDRIESASSVLDELFDHVESASAGSESGIQ